MNREYELKSGQDFIKEERDSVRDRLKEGLRVITQELGLGSRRAESWAANLVGFSDKDKVPKCFFNESDSGVKVTLPVADGVLSLGFSLEEFSFSLKRERQHPKTISITQEKPVVHIIAGDGGRELRFSSSEWGLIDGTGTALVVVKSGDGEKIVHIASGPEWLVDGI